MGGARAQGLRAMAGTLALLRRQQLRDSCEQALLLAAGALLDMRVPRSHPHGASVGPGCGREIWGSHSENSGSLPEHPQLSRVKILELQGSNVKTVFTRNPHS